MRKKLILPLALLMMLITSIPAFAHSGCSKSTNLGQSDKWSNILKWETYRANVYNGSTTDKDVTLKNVTNWIKHNSGTNTNVTYSSSFSVSQSISTTKSGQIGAKIGVSQAVDITGQVGYSKTISNSWTASEMKSYGYSVPSTNSSAYYRMEAQQWVGHLVLDVYTKSYGSNDSNFSYDFRDYSYYYKYSPYINLRRSITPY